MRKKSRRGGPPASAKRRVMTLTLRNLADRITADPSTLDNAALREALVPLGLTVEAWLAARLKDAQS